MVRQASLEEIQSDWEVWESALAEAMTTTPGGLVMGGNTFKVFAKNVYDRLTNPFNRSMQMWLAFKDDEPCYMVLTQIQVCEFSEQKTLLWFSITRIRDVDTSTSLDLYFQGQKVVKKFAKDNGCVAIVGYSDLDYFTRLAETKDEWAGTVKRNFYYLPLN